ncbi:MAG: electron transfer flavoprotein subunit alpha/FixB family protein [Hungatella sp.]|nr:electron transfer flavoprotein subunit alpha/FixB family protein [Hungatella sp.]
MKVRKIVVYSEDRKAVCELASGAAGMADEVTAVVLGSKEDAREAAEYCSQVVLVPKQEGTMAEAYVPAVEKIIREENPVLVLMASTRRGKCAAGRLAVRLDAGVATEVNRVEPVSDHEAVLKKMVYGGAAVASLKSAGKLSIALAGVGSYEAEKLPEPGTVREAEVSFEESGMVCTKVQPKAEERVNLNAAKRIVGAGRGVGAQEKLGLLEDFAKKIGAEMACSRPIAEGEKWMPKNRYLGVSGVVVKPDVYVACGISGQVQHMVGVNEARVIIAVNKDKNAPIFKHCDFGIVGELNKVVPALTELL